MPKNDINAVWFTKKELWDVVVCLQLSRRNFPEEQQERIENLCNRLMKQMEGMK